MVLRVRFCPSLADDSSSPRHMQEEMSAQKVEQPPSQNISGRHRRRQRCCARRATNTAGLPTFTTLLLFIHVAIFAAVSFVPAGAGLGASMSLLFCDAKEIVATNEWQKLGENDTIPAGLHVKMDISTGERWAKIPSDDDDEEATHSTSLVLFVSWCSSSSELLVCVSLSSAPLFLAVGVEGRINNDLVSLKTSKAFFAAVEFMTAALYERSSIEARPRREARSRAYRGRRRNLLCILRALCRRQFLEPEAERCGVGKLTMRRIILSFLFFHFPFLRVYFAKKHFCALFRLMQKNNSRYSFWSRHRKNTRKYTSPYR